MYAYPLWDMTQEISILPTALTIYFHMREVKKKKLITDVIIYSARSFVVYLCNEYLMGQLLQTQIPCASEGSIAI